MDIWVFQHFAITNNASMNNFVHIFFAFVELSFTINPRSKSEDIAYVILLDITKFPSIRLITKWHSHHVERAYLLKVSPACIVKLLNFCQFDK